MKFDENMAVESVMSDSLDYLRSILVKSLSSENVGKSDVIKVNQYKNKKTVTFDTNNKHVVDKEARLKILKDRQNEERQKKLEEIKAQALAAQRFKEQKEFERRRRIEDLKGKEDVRRQQVEERKKAIELAEQDRLVSILKRNQEREARIEAKKRNERSSIVFAFGSSTPRMLDPTDMTSSFWGHRRATSIQNITSASTASLTRRQSERDLDGGSKKRATSASGLERSGESSTPLTPAGCASGYVGRRRTDLMPTIPSRDSPFAASRKSLNHSPASSRPSSSLSQQSTTSVTSSVSVRHRPSTAPRRQRPASIAITGISHDLAKNAIDNKKIENNKPPLPKTRKTISKDKSNKNKASPVDGTPKSLASPVSAMSTSILENNTAVDDILETTITTAVPEPEPPQIVTVLTEQKEEQENNNIAEESDRKEEVPLENLVDVTNPSQVEEVEAVTENNTECLKTNESESSANTVTTIENVVNVNVNNGDDVKLITAELIKAESTPVVSENKKQIENTTTEQQQSATLTESGGIKDEMTTSVTKVRINTEEEAKAALAERRRLIREEAERQAEQERLRAEMEAQAELERQRFEEEQVQKLIEQQRIAEQERLEEAIKETQRREEEERLRREEEQRSKLLKEEAERKAREENEKKMAEQAERIKNEEKEREARRKRVEAIMRRTRTSNANSTSQNSEDKNENKSENKINGTKPVQQENGTKNGKDVDLVDNNIIPDDTVKNANTVSIDTINSTDSINSNNTWQATQQYDSLM